MVLTDTDLRGRISASEDRGAANQIQIHPFSEDCLTPVGYDLRVGGKYASVLHGGPFEIQDGDSLEITPGDTTLITTLETIGMPGDRSLSAFIFAKVSKVSRGLSHISTTVDADWAGPLLIAVTNHSTSSVVLDYGEPFCTIVFMENVSPSTKACGKLAGRLDVLLERLAANARSASAETRR
jgi:deoxycytidine triphosphate deaminase